MPKKKLFASKLPRLAIFNQMEMTNISGCFAEWPVMATQFLEVGGR
jgi:hypothetical protein